MKTYLPKDPGLAREWVLIDADNQVLGTLAVEIANMLRGKDKPIFSKQVDTGDFVVVINAEKVKLTGTKEDKKLYQRYSGFRGGLKKIPASEMRKQHPEDMIRNAVKGMLPKNNLSRQTIKRLKIYTGDEHPHAAQLPRKLELS